MAGRWTTLRRAGTWSPLAQAFNTRPALHPLHLLKRPTGLFGREELQDAEGLYAAKEAAVRQADELVAQATAAAPLRPLVHIFDELSDTLCKVADLAEFVRVAHPDPRFACAAEDVCIAISTVVEKLNTEVSLYEALAAAVRRGDSGDERVASLFLGDFEQSGIHLAAPARARVRELQRVALHAGQRFVQDAAAPRVLPAHRLPPSLRPHFRVLGDTLEVHGLHAEAACAEVREAAYRGFLAPDERQEVRLVRLLTARRDLARLCGFRSYADRAAAGGVLGSADDVRHFLALLADRLRPRATADFAEMRRLKLQHSPQPLGCWDTAFYTQSARADCLAAAGVDAAPYFSLGAVLHGLDECLQAQLGISLRPLDVAPGETWSPDVHKLGAVHESEGLLGHVYCDLLERPGKPHHDCHFTIQAGRQLSDDTYQMPVVVVMMSLRAAVTGAAWLTPAALDNLCHELGHALHSLLGRTRFQHVAGTRCSTDLAELPSVLAERFPADPRVSGVLLRHVATGEPAPLELRHRLAAAPLLFAASDMQLQVFYSALDQAYHDDTTELTDTTAVLRDLHAQHYGVPYVHDTAWQHRFSHLVGYGAKYYAYLVSRALAWLVWRREFAAAPLSRAAGERWRRGVLAHGGARAPAELLRDFLGEPVTPELLADALADELDSRRDLL